MTRSNTADRILDVAETLIQTRGYSAFSYHDVAAALGVTKASIHYHFPSKTDLGAAVIDRYAQRMGEALGGLLADPALSAVQLLNCYAQPYLAFSQTDDRVCLSAALAGEILALPEALKDRIHRFFEMNQIWLTEILTRGQSNGEFVLSAPPAQMARLAFGALQGALLVKRTTGDRSQVTDVLAGLQAQLAPARTVATL